MQSEKALRCVEIFSVHSAKGTATKDTKPVALECVEIFGVTYMYAKREVTKDTKPVALECVEIFGVH